MSNGVQEPTETAIKEAGEIMAEALTHPWGWLMLVGGLLALMWGYGRLIVARRGPTVEDRLAALEQQKKA